MTRSFLYCNSDLPFCVSHDVSLLMFASVCRICLTCNRCQHYASIGRSVIGAYRAGFLYDHGHLSRGVCCRLEKEPSPLGDSLSPPYRVNHPWLGRVTACQPVRDTQKTKALSVNWVSGDADVEILDGTVGRCSSA